MQADIKTTFDVMCQINFEKQLEILTLKDKIKALEEENERLNELLQVREGVKEMVAFVQEKDKRGRHRKED